MIPIIQRTTEIKLYEPTYLDISDESTQCVDHCIQYTLDRVDEKIKYNSQTRFLHDHACNTIISEINNTKTILDVNFDEGEDSSNQQQIRFCEDEPIPANIDCWAKYTITTKLRDIGPEKVETLPEEVNTLSFIINTTGRLTSTPKIATIRKLESTPSTFTNKRFKSTVKVNSVNYELIRLQRLQKLADMEAEEARQTREKMKGIGPNQDYLVDRDGSFVPIKKYSNTVLDPTQPNITYIDSHISKQDQIIKDVPNTHSISAGNSPGYFLPRDTRSMLQSLVLNKKVKIQNTNVKFHSNTNINSTSKQNNKTFSHSVSNQSVKFPDIDQNSRNKIAQQNYHSNINIGNTSNNNKNQSYSDIQKSKFRGTPDSNASSANPRKLPQVDHESLQHRSPVLTEYVINGKKTLVTTYYDKHGRPHKTGKVVEEDVLDNSMFHFSGDGKSLMKKTSYGSKILSTIEEAI